MFPNPPAVDEAVFMQNRQLLSQLQGNAGLQFGQSNNKPPAPPQAAALGAPFLKPAQPAGLVLPQQQPQQQNGQASFLGMHNPAHLLQANNNATAVQPGLFQRGPSPALPNNAGGAPGNHAGGMNQAALMQAMLQQGQLGASGAFLPNAGAGGGQGNNAGFMPNNSIAAAAAAAATVAATQQAAQQAQRAAQAQASQATRAAVVSYLQQQQQQQQQQQMAAAAVAAAQQQRQNLAGAQQATQNAAWLNAAVQRAVASGQLVIQNGKPVLVPQQQAASQQQAGGQVGNPAAAAQIMQQLHAAQLVAAAQKQAQHAHMVKQIQAVLAQQAKATTQQAQVHAQANQSAMAMLQQAQLHDVLSAAGRAGNGLQHGGGGLGAGPGFPGTGFPGQVNLGQAQAQAQAQALAQAQAQQRIRQNMAALASLTPAQLQALTANPALANTALTSLSPAQLQTLATHPAFAQLILQARAAAAGGQGQQPQPQLQQQAQQLQQQAQQLQQQQLQQQHLQQQQQMQPQGNGAGAQLGMSGPEALLASLRQAGADPWARAAQQQGGQQGQAQGLGAPNASPAPDVTSPTSSTSSSPPNAAGKEQRRIALACVAMQLAQQGISIEQAIHSGLMGGMSATDVHFIMEVYGRHVRGEQQPNLMKAVPGGSASAEANGSVADAVAALGINELPGVIGGASSGGGGGGGVVSAGQEAKDAPGRVGTPRTSSPAPSSHAGSELGGGRSNTTSLAGGGTGVGAIADIGADLPGFDNDAFNAFSYGFFGAMAGPEAGELLGELEPAALEGGALEGALEGALDGALEGGLEGAVDGAGLEADLGPGGESEDSSQNLGLAPGQAWLAQQSQLLQGRSAASMPNMPKLSGGSGLWQNVVSAAGPGSTGAGGADDLAYRLDNLDLGSGFF